MAANKVLLSTPGDSEKKPDAPQVPEVPEGYPNPNFYFGSDGFQLQNGDCYVGGYCCHKNGITWREGPGIYMTKDGHSYQGTWENDILLNSEDTTIKYACGIEYQGTIQKGKYSGPGTYILENKLPISAQFQENLPASEVCLTDPNGRFWKGMPTPENVLLLPENHFYVTLPYEKGVGKEKFDSNAVEAESDEISGSYPDMEELKNVIFAKSVKTINDFSKLSSCQEYILEKMKSRELGRTESVIRRPKPKSSLVKARSSSASLLKTFLSKDYQNACTPIPVFYPTGDYEKFEEKLEEPIDETKVEING